MPVYLLHGFRWPRDGFTGIRVHAIVHNLEDMSVEYIQNPNSTADILRSFRTLYPEIMNHLEGPGRPGLEFLEQYDPDDLTSDAAVSQPYAFVGDRVVIIAGGPAAVAEQAARNAKLDMERGRPTSPVTPIKKRDRAKTLPMSIAQPFNTPSDPAALSVNVEDVVADGPGLTPQAWEAMADLRDKIADGEKIGWWVVYNGDPKREYEPEADDESGEEQDTEEDTEIEAGTVRNQDQTEYASGRDRAVNPSQGKEAPLPSSSSTGAPQIPPLFRSRSPISSVSSSTAPPPPPPTALPVREKGKSKPPTMTAKQEKDSVVPSDTAKLKEIAKSQGLRKKFFGKRA